MKNISKFLSLFSLLIASIIMVGCAEDDVEVAMLSAGFTQTINQNTGTVRFINTSENAISYAWDFGDETTSTVANPIKTYTESGVYTVTLQVFDEDGQTATFQDIIEIEIVLLTNGDFENGSQGWLVGVDDNSSAPVVTEDGNSFYEVNITNPNPNQPFLVNLSQKVPIIQGETYILTFDAWSDRERPLIAGIGLSGGDFSNNVETVNLTETQQQFELTLSAEEFGAPDARVLFDSNGAAGLVRIDNVSLVLQ